MSKQSNKTLFSYKEAIFQVILHVLVFLFYSFDRERPQIASYQYVFFLSYALAGLMINYYLLPRFFYLKKYASFFIGVLLILIAVILLEEFVLEKIYFPHTRGRRFSGFSYAMLDILPLLTIFSGFKFAWDALGKQREVDELKTAVKESELQFLKSQINPHFLFNNLHNLYSYAIEQSPKTPEIILELSGVLRYMLYECKENYVPLQKEISQLQNFIQLSELQIEDRGAVNFQAAGHYADYQIAPLILIVFIENAFKHSTASQADGITIYVRLALEDSGTLQFSCQNSYQPQSNTDRLSQGIGLENVKKRLQLLYPDAHQLDIQKSEQLYTVKLSIELNKLPRT